MNDLASDLMSVAARTAKAETALARLAREDRSLRGVYLRMASLSFLAALAIGVETANFFVAVDASLPMISGVDYGGLPELIKVALLSFIVITHFVLETLAEKVGRWIDYVVLTGAVLGVVYFLGVAIGFSPTTILDSIRDTPADAGGGSVASSLSSLEKLLTGLLPASVGVAHFTIRGIRDAAQTVDATLTVRARIRRLRKLLDGYRDGAALAQVHQELVTKQFDEAPAYVGAVVCGEIAKVRSVFRNWLNSPADAALPDAVAELGRERLDAIETMLAGYTHEVVVGRLPRAAAG
jgi:hypothetical protein